uniref:Uncharacterized protein n=1 Tax=Ralstonia solanacearum TaxID=305 RepID=A0A0S4TNJ3_RALSL|nr:protein of unknown function [Ralstonia solanacearum]
MARLRSAAASAASVPDLLISLVAVVVHVHWLPLTVNRRTTPFSLASARPGRSKTVRLRTNSKLLTPPSGSACFTQGHGTSGQPHATAPRRCFCCLAQNSHMPWATGQTTTVSFPLSGPCSAFHPPSRKRSSNAS